MRQKQNMLTIALALFAGLVGGMISCEFFTGQTVFAEKAMDTFTHVTAEWLQIVDENGTVRATLGVGLDGGVRFSMLDENHVPRITMKAAKDTGSLSLWAVGEAGASFGPPETHELQGLIRYPTSRKSPDLTGS